MRTESKKSSRQSIRLKSLVEILALVLSYLFGSFPAGLLFARLYRLDIRTVGSGNIGATNVQRALGWGPGLIVLVFDTFKGGLVILAARYGFHLEPAVVSACGLAAVLGHNFSIFLKFKGGKGVATSLGTTLFLSPEVGVFGMLLGLTVMFLTRFVSAGSILGAVASTLYALFSGQPLYFEIICVILTTLMIWSHRENIKRLQAGVENRIGVKIPRKD
jgi:acyl phosphate:glycerol-3-phosphate acyltransferase